MEISKELLQKQLKENEEMLKKIEGSYQQLLGQKYLLIDLLKKTDEEKK